MSLVRNSNPGKLDYLLGGAKSVSFKMGMEILCLPRKFYNAHRFSGRLDLHD